MRVQIIAALLGLTLSAGVIAQVKPEDQIKFRQSGYTFMSWNMGKLKAMLIDQPASFNKEQAQAAANVIAAVANSGMGALFGAGTDKGKGWKETRLKPEFFQQPDEVRTVAVGFVQEANELARLAAAGDPAALKAQFAKVGDACGACHKKFRRDE